MRAIAILIATLTLVACGSRFGTDLDTASVPEPPLDRMYRTFATYNSVVSSSFHVLGETQGVEPVCGSTWCATHVPHPTLGYVVGFEGRSSARLFGSASWTPQGEIGGLEIWELSYTTDSVEYGVWMDHSFFAISTLDAVDYGIVAGAVFGRIYDDVPFPLQGTAGYDGAIVARDVISATHYAGTAHLEVDFAAASLDATFSNIAATDSGETLADIRFAQVALLPDRHVAAVRELPSADGTDTYLNARFYGPDHEELTGVFGKDTLIGAFGAKRQ